MDDKSLDEIRGEQRAEALRQKNALQSLTENPGWKILDAFLTEQIAARTHQIILQPCTGVKSQLEQEYSKGEIATMMLVQRFVSEGILTATEVVRSLNDERTADDSAGYSGSSADADSYD